MGELAAEAAAVFGKPVELKQLSESDYAAALLAAGLPPEFATIIASIDTAAQSGTLFDDGKALEGLLGRPTTTLGDFLRALG
jgi:NAD(P)H dehydrogenase (quinone)